MKASISRFFNNTVMLLKKHSPEILTIVGAIGVGVGCVMLCKATTKVEETIDEFDEKKKELAEERETIVNNADEDCDLTLVDQQFKKDLTKLYFKTGWEFVKLYGPGVLVVCGSVGSLIGANGILKKRNASIMAAYAVLKERFDSYRANAMKYISETAIKNGAMNIKDPENGEIVETRDEDVQSAVINEVNKSLANKKPASLSGKDLEEYSEYARFFDETCKNWVRDPSANLATLNIQQRFANQLLVNRGHVLLNDVYDMLGMPRTSEGAVVGWVYDPNNPEKRISFGIYELKSEGARRFVNGYEPSILLDFNVDGIIYDKITPSWARIYE